MARWSWCRIGWIALGALLVGACGSQPAPLTWATGPAEEIHIGWHTPAVAESVELHELEPGAALPLIWGIQGEQMVLLGFDIPPDAISDEEVSCTLTRLDDGRDIAVPKIREGVTLEERDTGAITYTNFFLVAVPGAFEWAGSTPALLACHVCGLEVAIEVEVTDPTPGPEPDTPPDGRDGQPAPVDGDREPRDGVTDPLDDGAVPGDDRHHADDPLCQPAGQDGSTDEPAEDDRPVEDAPAVGPAWEHCTDAAEMGMLVELWPICRVCMQSTQLPLMSEPTQAEPRFTRLEWGLEAVPTEAPAGFSNHPTWSLVEDMDADGIPDLLLGTEIGQYQHWWARGVAPGDAAEGQGPFLAPVPFDLGSSGGRRCLGAADLDGDGYRDLLCDDANDKLGVVMWGSDAGFGPDSDQLPLVDPGLLGNGYRMRSASFGDIDNDGIVDLFLAGEARPEVALLGAGDRQFLLASSVLGMPQENLWTFFATPFAWDARAPGFDGVWVANDGQSKPNRALRVQSGKAKMEAFDPIPQGCDFVRVPMMNEWVGFELTMEQLGTIGNESRSSGQGSKELGTFDGKGTTTPMGSACWFHLGEVPLCVLSQAGGPTADYALANTTGQTWGLVYGLGLTRGRTTEGYFPFSWGMLPLDLGDGRVDLLITNARSADSVGINPMDYYILGQLLGEELGDDYGDNVVRYYAEQDDGAFAEVGEAIGLDGLGQFATVTRFFAEGPAGPQLHLLIGGFDQPFVVYRLDAPTGNHVRVNLRGTASEPNGLGALLTVVGGPRVRRARYGLESVQWPTGNTTREAVFGVGGADEVEVWVQWPSGAVERFVGVAADSMLHTLEEGQGEDAPGLPELPHME